jgi:hypothetical protein
MDWAKLQEEITDILWNSDRIMEFDDAEEENEDESAVSDIAKQIVDLIERRIDVPDTAIMRIADLQRELAELLEKLRWIPVSERLPEIDDEVECGYWVTLPDGKQVKIVYIGSLNDYGDWVFLNSLGEYHTLCMPIQFWREIPELEDGE